MSGPRVGLIGEGPVMSAMAERLRRSQFDIAVTDVAAVGEFDATSDLWDDENHSRILITSNAAPDDNYLGVVSSRQANLFHIDASSVDYIGAAIDELAASGSTRVQVRVPIERSWLGYVRANGGERKRSRELRRFDSFDYDFSSADIRDEGVYDGPAQIVHDDEQVVARIRVQGYFDPLDGQYHWAGIVFGEQARALKDARVSAVEVAVDSAEPVPARLAEVTPWGTVRITGVGAPPYRLDDAELLVRA